MERRDYVTKTDEEGPVLPPPKRGENPIENPIEKPIKKPIEKQIEDTKPEVPPPVIKKVSPTDAFKSDIAKDKWPAGLTKTVGTDPDPMIASLRSG